MEENIPFLQNLQEQLILLHDTMALFKHSEIKCKPPLVTNLNVF